MPYPRILCGLLFYFILTVITACTDTENNKPWVSEIQAIPAQINITNPIFYNKPFTIRARYSDNTTINITKRITWMSENSQLLVINQQGEISLGQPCVQSQCTASIIATDPESGKSVRLSVNIKIPAQVNEKSEPTRKSAEQTVKTEIDQSSITDADNTPEVVEPLDIEDVQEAVQEDVQSITPGNYVTNVFPERASSTRNALQSEQAASEYIVTLSVEMTKIELQSGDQLVVPVAGLTNQNRRIDEVNNRINCVLVTGDEESLDILPGCQLVARQAGELQLKAFLRDNSGIGAESENFSVTVMPRFIGQFEESRKVTVQMPAENNRLWMQLQGAQAGAYYWFNLNGMLVPGIRLSILNHDKSIRQTCMNTMTGEMHAVSCYILATGNEFDIVIDKPTKNSISGNLLMKLMQKDEISQSHGFAESEAQTLALGNLVSSYIFANETGVGSKHYYQFQPDSIHNNMPVEIKLYDFSAEILLSVFWLDGYCNQKMLMKKVNRISCRLPEFYQGPIQIVVDGNNGGFGLANGPAAETGGSMYKLVIDALPN